MESPKINPAGKDPIFKILLNYGWKLVFYLFIVGYILALLPIIFSIPEKNFFNPGLGIDAFHDLGYHVQFLLLLPFFIIFAPYYLNALEDALKALRNDGIVQINEENYKKFVDYANEKFSHPIITVAPYLISFAVTAIYLKFFLLKDPDYWNSLVGTQGSTLAGFLSVVPSIILYHLIPGFICRVAAIYLVVKRYLSEKVVIHAFHPDRCGGVSPLGSFSLRITIAGIVVGCGCIIGIIADVKLYEYPLFSPIVILTFISYVLGLSIVFFIPLLAARKGMFEAKKNAIKLISDNFNVAMQSAIISMNTEGSNRRINVGYIDDLTKLYEVANGMPVYPFNSRNVVKFLSSVLWPLVLILISWIIGKL